MLTLKYFISVSEKYNFEKLRSKAEDWEKKASTLSVEEIASYWTNISDILLAMFDEANRIINLEPPQNLKNNKCVSLNLNNNQKSYFSRIEEDDQQRGILNTPVVSKKFVTIPKINNIITPASLNKREDDLIFLELKPVKFDCLYKKDLTSEELAEEIKKITQDGLNDTQSNTKQGTSMRNLKATGSAMVDCTYPFKNDAFRFDCFIL
jgi:hypothetical protein